MSQVESKKTVLITDDEPSTTFILSAISKGSYQVENTYTSMKLFLKFINSNPI